jgi:arylformamidase
MSAENGLGSELVYLDYDQAALDRAYEQRAWAPKAAEQIERYARVSAAVRAAHPHYADIVYGAGQDELLDWFPAHATRVPIHIHLHGGAWRALTKSDVSFAAPAFTRANVQYVAPSFTNLPAVRLPEMVAQVAAAVAFVYRNAERFRGDPNRIFISGHSSGAHLCAVLLTRDWSVDGLPRDVLKGGVCISGSYDLRPVLLSARRNYMTLDEAEVLQFSPIHHVSSIECPVAVAYGARESPEFIRQAKAFAEALSAAGRTAEAIHLEDADHFEMAERLSEPGGAIHAAALAQIARTDT